MTPKIFHFVWIGPNPLPPQDAAWLASWPRFHPGWQCLVWSDQVALEVPDGFELRPLPALVNRRFYDSIETWVSGRAAIAARSDIVRYEVVTRMGGIYLDTDVECFAPIDDLLHGVRLCYFEEWGPCEGNYAFGGVANHPALWTLVRELGPHLAGHAEPFSVLDATGPRYMGARLRAHPDCVIFPHMILNPLHARADASQVTRWPLVSRGNHHFAGKWYEQQKVAPPDEFMTPREEKTDAES